MSVINSVKNCKYSILVKKTKKIKNLKNREKKIARYRHLYILLTGVGIVFFFVWILFCPLSSSVPLFRWVEVDGCCVVSLVLLYMLCLWFFELGFTSV